MSAWRPGEIAVVGGQRCVVLRDAVAHALPSADDVVVIDRFGAAMVYCAADELKRARERHPGLAAYGFWQVLFHSELANPDERLQAVHFSAGDGQYLYRESPAILFTGEIRNGKLIANAGYALESSAARVIDCNVQRLRLPRKMVLSFAERERERASRRLRFVLCFAAAAVFLGAAWFAYDLRQTGRDAGLQTIRDALEVRAKTLALHKAELRNTRIGAWPDQRRVLDDLLRFVVALEEFTLPETPLDHPAFEVRVQAGKDGRIETLGLPPLLSTVVTSVGHRRDGLLSLRRRPR